MTVAVFHGSPRKKNTYAAAKIFTDELLKNDGVTLSEFFLPEAMPEFCTGCQLCLAGRREMCPQADLVTKTLDAIISSDAIIFTTPHFGAGSMSGCMKNLLDHLDFLTLTISPRPEIFTKKAFIITTGSGSASAIKPIESYLRNWGINRVYKLGIRMFTNKWEVMNDKRRAGCEKKLRMAALKFYRAKKKRPYLRTIFMYYVSRFVIKKYIGAGNYPYEYWNERGYFKKRPF